MMKAKTVTLLLSCLLHSPFLPVSPSLLLPSPFAYAQHSEVESLVKRIESRYGRMRGLAADFVQTYRAPGVRPRSERGRLVLQRPRRMRWEYNSQPSKLFIVNGREVWFYVPADREATRVDASAVSDARFPFLFLLGNTDLRRAFRSITLVEQNSSSPGAQTLRLIPQDKAAGLREILLEVLPDGRITKVSLTDEAGAISEVALENVHENFIAPAEAFIFHPPPGVRVRQK